MNLVRIWAASSTPANGFFERIINPETVVQIWDDLEDEFPGLSRIRLANDWVLYLEKTELAYLLEKAGAVLPSPRPQPDLATLTQP
jgi:hypothetical protein